MVFGYLILERLNGLEYLGLIILLLGEVFKYGVFMFIISFDLKIFIGLLIEDIYFWYCFKVIGLYLSLWLVYFDEKGFGFIRFFIRDLWFFFLFFIRLKLEVVNWNFFFSFYLG